ncbi:MAG: hypothetical protein CMI54_00990 [Parcubacteria group bacterium]|jgi:triosephosphate isomerase|nr:hypothetical protein [Parcubacteria group bacterium]|tara:strand:- start:1589 stop:2242 length:654 start_codon:yes stop_codon:yes gene_type:complete
MNTRALKLGGKRKPIVVANWKMNPQSLREAKALFNRVKKTNAIICPPSVYLSELKAKGAQDCFLKKRGAFTGEISPLMLKNLGVKYVIIGHSERRKYQKETKALINRKLKAALKVGLKPILCIDKISQIPKDIKNLIIAYEPLSAIGNGKPLSIEKAKKMRYLIKKKTKNLPLLYGGSVTFKNAGDYIKKAGFQGLLVGGASLKPNEFVKIIEAVRG